MRNHFSVNHIRSALSFLEVSDGGRHVEMKETLFSARLSDLVETYLRKHNSVPAFLAALTLELVGNHTLLQL